MQSKVMVKLFYHKFLEPMQSLSENIYLGLTFQSPNKKSTNQIIRQENTVVTLVSYHCSYECYFYSVDVTQ